MAFVVLDPMPRAVESGSRSLDAALVVPPGSRACERRVDVPAGTGAVELVISTAGKPGGSLPVVISKADRVVTRGRHPGGYVDSPVRVRLGEVRERVSGAQVCVANPEGPELALLGAGLRRQDPALGWVDDLGAPAGPPARVLGAGSGRDQAAERIRMEWQFGREQSHASFAGEIAQRVGLIKAPSLGSGLMWLALALTLVASLTAVALVTREGER